LAKTDISTDRLVEEELNAARASRWLKDNGAVIISTSLSFNKFDNADYYFSNQMDGKTALITKTADSIVSDGVLYFCSAGNNYEEEWHIIEPPGDGFNVIAVGSIDKNQIHSFFSSCGPTIDGRIKPDIMAPGENVWNANYFPKMKPEFGWNHGTSLAAPIAAGVAALVLSAHPELTPNQVIEAIKNTASKSNSPDNIYGWGIPDAEKAVTYFGPAFSNKPDINLSKSSLEIKTFVFSSYGLDKSSIEAHVKLKNDNDMKVIKLNEIDENTYSFSIDLLSTNKLYFYFTAKDLRGKITKFPSGILGENFIYNRSDDSLILIEP
jgi:serine protease AprX